MDASEAVPWDSNSSVLLSPDLHRSLFYDELTRQSTRLVAGIMRKTQPLPLEVGVRIPVIELRLVTGDRLKGRESVSLTTGIVATLKVRVAGFQQPVGGTGVWERLWLD